MPTQALPGPNSLCYVSLQKTRRRFFLQRSSTKRYGAAVQEQIPARYGGISLTSGPRSVPKIPMSMTLSRFMGRDIFLPAGKPVFSRSDSIFPDLYAAFRKCLFFFTFPGYRDLSVTMYLTDRSFLFVKIYDQRIVSS